MRLGVGKNMAHAIRYWCEAFGLIEPGGSTALTDRQVRRPLSEVKERRAHQLTPTARDLIAGAQALDPYLESTASLWWLHYQLIKTQKATTWHFAINHFGRTTFTAAQLLDDLKSFVRNQYPDHKVAESSLIKDVQLFLRMYSLDEKERYVEDSIDSPFTELGLLKKRGDTYSFAVGKKPTLPDAIITAAVLDYAATRNTTSKGGAKTVTFSELMTADGSPVKAFRLTENDLYDALEKNLTLPLHNVEREKSAAQGVRREEIFLSDTAGTKQLAWKDDPHQLMHRLLRKYYRHALH